MEIKTREEKVQGFFGRVTLVPRRQAVTFFLVGFVHQLISFDIHYSDPFSEQKRGNDCAGILSISCVHDEETQEQYNGCGYRS